MENLNPRNGHARMLLPNEFDLKKFIKVQETDYDKKMHKLKQSESSIAINYTTFLKKYLKYLHIAKALIPVYIKNFNYEKLNAEDKKIYDDYINELNSDEDIEIPSYKMALNQYFKWLILSHSLYSEEQKLTKINQVFKGQSKRYLLFNVLKNFYGLKTIQSQLQSFLEQKDKYSSYLNDRMKGTQISSEKLLAAKGGYVDWQGLLSKYKGKVIYVDFWASWCLPCRKSFPYALKLKENLVKQNQEVKFIYISIDKSVNDWRLAMEEEKLIKDDCYFLPETNVSLIKQYQINSIPRYFIIGRNGEIINDDALPPSDKRLENHLIKIALAK